MDNKEEIKIQIDKPCDSEVETYYTSFINKLMVDFVVNDLDSKKLSEKYNVDQSVIRKITRDHKFEKRKEEYQDKLFSLVLKKTQNRQAATIANITKIINLQVNRIMRAQNENPNYIVGGSQMKDLIAILAVLSKEYRLDHGQSTDNSIHKVVVEMSNSVPIISENHIKQEAIEVETVKEEIKEVIVEEKKEEEAKTISTNQDMFGPIS